MRLLVVNNLYPPVQLGGYELSCQAFVEHMLERGAKVRVLTARGDAGEDDGGVVVRELWCYLTPLGRLESPGWAERWRRERRNQRVLRTAVARLRPDAVMWWNMGGVSLSMIEQVRRMRLPAAGVVCDNWMVWAGNLDPWHRAGRRLRGARGWAGALAGAPFAVDLSAAARWVFVSEHVRRRAQREIGPLERTEVVHSGIPVARYRRRDPRAPWHGRLLTVGRVTEAKGVDTAVRALALLPEARLTVVGSGTPEYVDALQRLAGDLGVAERITWLGGLAPERVAATYAEHDALLFPIRWEEPWGKVPLEAMASGLPVVATPRGGSAEYLEDGVNCLAAAEQTGVARAVARLTAEPELRARLVARGLGTAAAHDVARANALRERAVETAIRETRAPSAPRPQAIAA